MRNPYQIKIYEPIDDEYLSYFKQVFDYQPDADYATLDEVKKEYERMVNYFYDYVYKHLDKFEYNEMENTITIMADWDWWYGVDGEDIEWHPEYYRMYVTKDNVKKYANYEFCVVSTFLMEPESRDFIYKRAGSDMPW